MCMYSGFALTLKRNSIILFSYFIDCLPWWKWLHAKSW